MLRFLEDFTARRTRPMVLPGGFGFDALLVFENVATIDVALAEDGAVRRIRVTEIATGLTIDAGPSALAVEPVLAGFAANIRRDLLR